MIEYIDGDLFDSPAQTIVNTVNTVGVMGKGLALAFKERYPEMFNSYRKMCEKHKLQIGKLMLYPAPDHLILLFPTKENWRNPSKIEYIEKGLVKFVGNYAEHNITSIAFPKLGCGNGELDWNDVKPVMEKYLKHLPIDVYIYIRNSIDPEPEHKNPQETMKWLRKNAKDLSFPAVKDDIAITCGLLPYIVTVENTEYEVTYNEGVNFKSGTGKSVFIAEDDFYKIWDSIRTEKVFVRSNDSKRGLIEALLFKLSYLSEIKVVDNENSVAAGFQVREGLGRIFALNGSYS